MQVTARQRRAPGRGPEPSQRPGIRSRIRPAAERKRRWRISDSQSFPLPVIVDHLSVDPATSEREWLIEATIDLVEGVPATPRRSPPSVASPSAPVVSWVEKVRRRGILTKVPAGSHGGEDVPRSRRPAT